ncbi:hypothetical protein DXG03_004806 [Asterophora parasitica]|uniref:F-box domain-containing protein n=1 Tax=Asterophora parasitica TaxID=117018 RepID=A0A9P7K7Q5_9AGAR|nr:hypothetical protein DXG03_004806 [Asterophora parasitica]
MSSNAKMLGLPTTEIPSPPTPSSPISQLPNELLQEVLLHILPEISDDAFHCDSGLTRSTHTFSAVCHRWKEIALSTREMWASVAFKEPRRTSSSRLHSITYWNSVRRGLNAWFKRADPSAALSLSLTFTTNNGSRNNGIWPQAPAALDQPIIKHVLPWHRLAELHINDPFLFPLSIANALRVCPNLTRLYVDGVNCFPYSESDAEGDAEGGLIQLPNLVELTLRVGCLWTFEDPDDTSLNYAFPGRMKVPALRELVISGQSGMQNDCFLARSVLESLIQSRAPITHLILHELTFNAFALFEVFADLPTLEYIHLSPKYGECGGFASACGLMAYDVDEVCNMLPNLHVLIIEDNFPDIDSIRTPFYYAFIEAMLNGTTFHIPDPSDWDKIIMEIAQTRRWDPKNYPFAQEGLRQLEHLEVTFGNAERSPRQTAESRNAAKVLLRGGLEVEYPRLGVSSKAARESEEIFGDDGLSDDDQDEEERDEEEQDGDGENDEDEDGQDY